jgi:NAD(P)-dependent dehydrogenase (short-subunit alcohol dehydrogenase family)
MDSYWRAKSAVVTGAASGIGLALAQALLERGAQVWMADIDGQRVQQAATALGGKARAESLDVRDAAAVRRLIERVFTETGQLDFMFNNAGVGAAGEVRDFGPEHFDRLVDVNIRGVVNGVTAAYPLMVQQKHGHIVNTASLAGLVPVGLLTPYAMSKHAIVGLTGSLRLEAASHGVRVSAICPAAVDTPLLDDDYPDGSARVWRPNVRRYLERLAGAPYPPGQLAKDALAGIEHNQGLIVVPARARLVGLLYRFAPALVNMVARRAIAAELSMR